MFIEFLIPNKKNWMDGVIYEYPTIIEHQKFNNKLTLFLINSQ